MFITARKRSLGQGNIFTSVCHSAHEERCAWLGGGGQGHAWQEGACMAGEMATAVGSVHPTGMHSSYICVTVKIDL